jgi:hypothetical protein
MAELYSPAKIVLTVGPNVITGFHDGTHIKADRNEDAWSTLIGNDGGGAWVYNPNESGYVEFSLRATSPSNAILDALADVDALSALGVVPVFVKDLFGLDQVHTDAARILRKPTMEWEKALGSRTWRLIALKLEIHPRGTAL